MNPLCPKFISKMRVYRKIGGKFFCGFTVLGFSGKRFIFPLKFVWMSVVLYDLVHDAETVLCDVMLLYFEISTQEYMQFTTVYRIFSEFCKN